jgi:hypothetical protein
MDMSVAQRRAGLRVLLPLLLIVALIAIAAAGYWLKRPAVAQAVACRDPLAGCVFHHHGTAVTVMFSVTPSPLDAFELRIHAPGARQLRAEFQMNGMEMGFNRYDLRRAEDGMWTATVTLPVCVSGRHDWTAYLEIDGARYALPFRTR